MMKLEYEQLEYKFEDGELHAPVSGLIKRFMYESMTEAIRSQDEQLFNLFKKWIKHSIEGMPQFQKTPKKFQGEVYWLLEQPLPVIHEMIHGKPLITGTEEKPKLMLVK